ncbi:MAG TPA: hypothetical protein VJO52_00075 [Gemmatimonadaceae bacterium]|nr:hypothetical protein [Gemmatimonadaceae bacterium]
MSEAARWTGCRAGQVIAAALACMCLTLNTGCTHREPTSSLAARRSESGTITSTELRTVDDRDAYTAIALLRPSLLKNRGYTSILLDTPDQPEVFIDGMYYGPFDTLRQLPVHELEEIRFLNVGDATLRYGTGHPAGIIDIKSIH